MAEGQVAGRVGFELLSAVVVTAVVITAVVVTAVVVTAVVVTAVVVLVVVVRDIDDFGLSRGETEVDRFVTKRGV